jgi:hypothetical protein
VARELALLDEAVSHEIIRFVAAFTLNGWMARA